MSIKCECKNSILQKAEDGSVKLRLTGPIVFSPEGVATSNCYWCKKTVSVPIELKKASTPQVERFIIAPKKK